MPSTTGGRPSPTNKARQNYKRKPTRRKTVSPPAPKPDVTLGGDKTPKRSGHARAKFNEDKTHSGRPIIGRRTAKQPLRSKKGERLERRIRREQRKSAREQAYREDYIRRQGERHDFNRDLHTDSKDRDALSKRGDVPTSRREERRFEEKAAARQRKDVLHAIEARNAHYDAAVSAPALKALEIATRPAKVTGNIIAGERVDRAVVKGAKGKGKMPGEALGLHGVAGFAADVALDPTTYTTLGTSVPAKVAAKKAAKKTYKKEVKKAKPTPASAAKGTVKKAERTAARKAAKRGATAAEAKRAATRAREEAQAAAGKRRVHVRAKRKANRAGQRAARGLPENKGLTIGIGPFRTSGKTTAKAVRRVRKGKDSRRIREVGTTVSPHVRPAGVSHREFEALKAAEREARAGTTRGRFKAVHLARGIKDAIPKKDYERVIDAIERGTVYDLPEHLRSPARKIEQAFNRARKAERNAGINTPQSRIGYFSHQLSEVLEDAPKVKGGTAGRTLNAGYTKGRKFEGTIKRIREEGGPDFSTDIPLVLASRLSASASDTAKARLNQAIIKAGRPVEPGMQIADDEALAVIKGKNLEWGDRKLEKQVADGTAPKDARYVVVNKRFVDRLTRGTAPGENLVVDNPLARGYDKVQGGFKFTATYINPGFHFRNLYGDAQNAYLAQALPSLATNLGRSARVLHRLDKQEEALLTLDKKSGKPGSLKVKDEYGRKVDMDIDSLAKEAEGAGAIRQGFLGRELPELLRGQESRVRRIGRGKATSRPMRAGRFAKRVIQNREDLIRLATYIGGRRQGLTAREAASRTMKHHFDYGDLSPFEREVLRRFFPFYTFTARNIPLQAKSFIAKPGKYANFEKAREHIGMAFDIDQDEFEDRLREYQQRGVPFPVEIDGNLFAVSTAFPLQDLNQLPWQIIANPSFASLADFGDEQVQKALSMLTPLLRTPTELYANKSFFFRGDIERESSPLVAAPSFVGDFPESWRKTFGIVKGIDRRSGKKVWMWPAKVDYIAKVVPGPSNFAFQAMTDGANRRNQGTREKLLSYGLGIKADPIDPQSAEIERLFDEKTELEKKRSALRQRGIGSEDYGRRETPEYRRVRDRLKAIDEKITKLSKGRGDKVPLLEVPRKKSDDFFGDVKPESKDKFFDDVRDTKEDDSFFSDIK